MIVIGGVVAGVILHNRANGGGSTGTGGGGAAVVHLSAINAYDPYGSPPGQEHNAQAPLATDGKGSTAWTTEDYRSSFAALHKPGVGLILEANAAVQLHEIGVATSTPGFTAVIRAGSSPTGPFDATVSPSETVRDGTMFTISAATYRLLPALDHEPRPESLGVDQRGEGELEPLVAQTLAAFEPLEREVREPLQELAYGTPEASKSCA